jgi:hypothetical protein
MTQIIDQGFTRTKSIDERFDCGNVDACLKKLAEYWGRDRHEAHAVSGWLIHARVRRDVSRGSFATCCDELVEAYRRIVAEDWEKPSSDAIVRLDSTFDRIIAELRAE